MSNITSPSKTNRTFNIKSSTFKVTGNMSTTISTEFNLCTGKKTKKLGYSSLIHGMYYAVISLVSVAAVFVVIYIALFYLAKR